MTTTNEVETDFTLTETANKLRVSTRWIRDRIKDGAEHQRYGHKIRFTEAQVAKLRTDHTKQTIAESITTGHKKRAS